MCCLGNGYTTEVPTSDDLFINVYIPQQEDPDDPDAGNLSPLEGIEQLIGDCYAVIISQEYTVKHVCIFSYFR